MGGMKFARLAILNSEALSALAALRRGGTEQQVQTRLRQGPTPTRCGPRGRERLFARRQGTKPCRAKRVRCRSSLRSSRRWLYFVNTFLEGVYKFGVDCPRRDLAHGWGPGGRELFFEPGHVSKKNSLPPQPSFLSSMDLFCRHLLRPPRHPLGAAGLGGEAPVR